MKHRRPVYYGYSNRTIILTIALFCSLFFGLGYSLLGTSLGLNGDVSVSKYDQTLYGVLEKAAKKGTYANTLSDSTAHRDSFSINASKNIYYWKTNSTVLDDVLNKQNVLFAGHCWQMYRTTDTGGVKLIYNGEAENSQCLNTRENHVGYDSGTNMSLLNTYYYGTDYTYDSNSNLFKLAGTISTGSISIGSYTCLSSSSTGSCSTLYLVERYNGTDYTVLRLDDNSHYTQFGKIRINSLANSMAYVGYMYNKAYLNYNIAPTRHAVTGIMTPPSGTVNFGTDIIYSNGVYTLQNVIQDEWSNFYSSSFRYYMCPSGGTSCSSVYYLLGGSSSSFYSISIKDGYYLDHFDKYYYYGDGFTDNGDNTYTINNSFLVKRSDWGEDPAGHKGYFYCEDSPICSNPRYIVSSNSLDFYDIYPNTYKYAYGFTYENGMYRLDDSSVDIWNYIEDNNLNNHHYTCFNEFGVCNTIYYVYYRATSFGIFYVELTNGLNINDAIEEMIHDENVNNYSSEIKFGAEAWYKKYLIDYNSYIDNNIFSYCRIQSNTNNGWNPDCTDLIKRLTFSNITSLTCPNETDLFSMDNSKAKINYPIGILNYYESSLLGGLRKTGKPYYLYYPAEIGAAVSPSNLNIQSDGTINNYVSVAYSPGSGARWVISLKPGTEYVSGTGSMADPYIVDAEPITPEQDKVRLTINYWNSTFTEKLATSISVLYNVGDTYNFASPSIDGYTADKSRVSGTITADTVIDVVYTPITFTLTVNFIYQDGSQAAPPHTETHTCINESYSVELPVISGFTPSRPSPATGNMPCRNTPLTIIYLPNSGGS